jgi:hypothetical protein
VSVARIHALGDSLQGNGSELSWTHFRTKQQFFDGDSFNKHKNPTYDPRMTKYWQSS